MRAIGEILRDQLYFLRQCGFDTFALRPGRNVAEALAAFDDFSDNYQATVAQPLPLFRRRLQARRNSADEGRAMSTRSGKVYLVGAGPGAPDLLTLRAARLLERADIVFYDALVHPDTIALAANARKIAVGKRCGKHSTAQQFINKRLVDAAAVHSVVVRLKGGDPMLFGRAQEEIAALEAAGVRYEVVPGITAALAASAEIGHFADPARRRAHVSAWSRRASARARPQTNGREASPPPMPARSTWASVRRTPSRRR